MWSVADELDDAGSIVDVVSVVSAPYGCSPAVRVEVPHDIFARKRLDHVRIDTPKWLATDDHFSAYIVFGLIAIVRPRM